MAPEEREGVRLLDLVFWFEAFQANYSEEFHQPLGFIEDSARIINEYYWELMESNVRPYLRKHLPESRIDRHKIISGMEMSIMFGLPVVMEDQDERLDVNSRLALFVAKQILISFNRGRIDATGPENFNREHRTWLQMVSAEGYPIFSNAATWYLFELLCLKN